MVESHNYQSANSRAQKLTNWTTLNRKVLSKFGFTIPRDIIEDIIQSKQNAVVLFLFGLRRVIEDKLQNKSQLEEPQVLTGNKSSIFYDKIDGRVCSS